MHPVCGGACFLLASITAFFVYLATEQKEA